jgi:hypothetical protein
MDFYTFLQSFLLIIIVGSIVVTGWFFITRGYEQVLEDGSIHRYGKIFKSWYFFWNKKWSEKEKIFYDKDHLRELYSHIDKKILPQFSLAGIYLVVKEEGLTRAWKQEFEYHHKVKLFDAFNQGEGVYRVYKEYDDYVYPSWVRDPLASCATCFASIYGSLFYWLLIAFCEVAGDVNLFAWCFIPKLAAVFFWICFCLCLAVVNTAIAKKYN